MTSEEQQRMDEQMMRLALKEAERAFRHGQERGRQVRQLVQTLSADRFRPGKEIPCCPLRLWRPSLTNGPEHMARPGTDVGDAHGTERLYRLCPG